MKSIQSHVSNECDNRMKTFSDVPCLKRYLFHSFLEGSLFHNNSINRVRPGIQHKRRDRNSHDNGEESPGQELCSRPEEQPVQTEAGAEAPRGKSQRRK